MAASRKSQVSTGDRSAKIRTYNFPQGRVTDHRIGLTLYRLADVLEGDLDELIDGLFDAEQADLLPPSAPAASAPLPPCLAPRPSPPSLPPSPPPASAPRPAGRLAPCPCPARPPSFPWSVPPPLPPAPAPPPGPSPPAGGPPALRPSPFFSF